LRRFLRRAFGPGNRSQNIASKPVLTHAMGEACTAQVFPATGTVDGTMFVVLFTAECINITNNKLRPVRQ
jgi:hypothetical protein